MSGDNQEVMLSVSQLQRGVLARTVGLQLTGAIIGQASLDGKGDVVLETTKPASVLPAGTYTKLTLDATGGIVGGEALSPEDLPVASLTTPGAVQLVDNLVTADSTKALTAAQGKQLKDFLDNINTILTSDDTSLDEIQEIVNYIKQNRQILEQLGISNIAGLEVALAARVLNTDSRLTDAREWTASTISQSEAETGTSTTRRAFTALRVRQAVAAYTQPFTTADRVKLDDIAPGAQVNVPTNISITGTGATRTINSSTGSSASFNFTAEDIGAAAATHSHTWTSLTDKPIDVSQAEAEAGDGTTRRYWTSERVRQNVAAYAPAKVPTRITSNITLVPNTVYHISGDRALMLPADVNIPIGSKIRLTKDFGTTSTLSRMGSELIRYVGGETDQLIFDVNREIVLVRNSTNRWELLI